MNFFNVVVGIFAVIGVIATLYHLFITSYRKKYKGYIMLTMRSDDNIRFFEFSQKNNLKEILFNLNIDQSISLESQHQCIERKESGEILNKNQDGYFCVEVPKHITDGYNDYRIYIKKSQDIRENVASMGMSFVRIDGIYRMEHVTRGSYSSDIYLNEC